MPETAPVVSPQAWAEAIDSPDRTPIWSLKADWDRDGQYTHDLSDLNALVASVTVTRDVATELPAQVGIVEGTSAATLAADLIGEWPGQDGLTPVRAFAPYRLDGPFHRAQLVGIPVTFDTGFVTEQGVKVVRSFTGSVRRISTASGNRITRFEALDGVNRMRAPISLRATGLDLLLLKTYGEDAYFSRINSQWLIDCILRRNNRWASPPAPYLELDGQAPVIAATMHGSTIPEAGFGGIPQERATGSQLTTEAWTNDGHPFGVLYPNPLAPAMTGTWRCERPYRTLDGQAVGVAMLVRLPSIPPTTSLELLRVYLADDPDDCSISVWVGTDRRLKMTFWHTPTRLGDSQTFTTVEVSSVTPPSEPTWVSFWGHVTFLSRTTYQLRWRLDDTVGSSTVQTTSSDYFVVPPDTGRVDYTARVPFSDLSVYQRGGAIADHNRLTHQPDAMLDPGANSWWGIPSIVQEDSWELLREVVTAEFGVAGFSPEGLFYFRSRAVEHPRGDREQITAQRNLADLVATTDEAGVRNTISGTTTPHIVGDWEDVVVATELGEFDAAPGLTFFDIEVPDDVVVTTSSFISYHSDDWDQSDKWAARNRVRLVLVEGYPADHALIGQFKLNVEIIRPGLLRIRINNGSNLAFRFATRDTIDGDGNVNNGEPALKIPGRRLQALPSDTHTIVDLGSVAEYGPRSYDLGGQSRWRQHQPSVAAITSSVLASLGRPAPVLENIETTHDPRRALFQPVEIVDPDGLGSVLGTITGIETAYSGSGARDVLTVRPLGPPGLGVLDDPELGKVGDTLIFGT